MHIICEGPGGGGGGVMQRLYKDFIFEYKYDPLTHLKYINCFISKGRIIADE